MPDEFHKQRIPAIAVAWIAIAIGIVVGIVVALWFGGRAYRVSRVPDTSLVWSFDELVTADQTVIERDAKGVYHLYLRGRENEAGHVRRPLKWQRVLAGRDLSVPLKGSPDEPGGEFRFWFGSVSRATIDNQFATSWFSAGGDELSLEEVTALAEPHGIDIDRWRIAPKRDSLELKLVGGFEGVRNGFIARGGQVFVPGAKEPLVASDVFMGQAEQARHYVTVKLPGASFENFLMTVDFAWGDQTLTFEPVVGARASLGDIAAELVLLEPFGMASDGVARGSFADCYGTQQFRVKTTTAAFFVSDPAVLYFMYPQMISKGGRSEIRYFNAMVNERGPDVRSVTMPVAMEVLDRIVLHHRHRRCRGVFSLAGLPVPDLEELP